jgi:hypothetical protein
MRFGSTMAASLLAWGFIVLLPAETASAHQEVTLGPVDFEIGFHDEPAYAGFQNAVFLSIHHADGRPVGNAADTLKVQVAFGSQSMDLPLEPNFEPDEGGEPGQYLASFIPTRPGPYTFHLTGSIAGQKIDRSFTSSPTTFDEVVDPTSVEFPAKDPTLGQVVGRLDREFPRLEDDVAAARKAAEDSAKTAKLLTVVALVVGAAALAVGITAWNVARGRSGPGSWESTPRG